METPNATKALLVHAKMIAEETLSTKINVREGNDIITIFDADNPKQAERNRLRLLKAMEEPSNDN